ncbi:MAG: ParM/StbA family protein [Oscillospiraceae bacterium]|nr:ParM/StbA family protein [Oscillospiraceae bacterium]
MSVPIIMGIDHGYAAMKTAHCCFPTGLVEYAHEPYSMENVLEYEGRYFVVGSGRQPLQKDKAQSEDYYLLTLAAIAQELDYRQAGPTAEVVLAAGLPLTSFGRDKKTFRKYLLRDKAPVSFRFAGKAYTVTIGDVQLFPQGYAAVLTQRELLEEPSVIVADIGGWTVDLMRIDNSLPNAATCRSLELGMIRCLDAISEQIRRSRGISMTSAQIESALRGAVSNLDSGAKEIIRAEAEKYVSQLLSAIQECGLDYRAMPMILLGGGASLFKSHVPPASAPCRLFLLDDVTLNAKGFERLCGQMSGRDGNG